MVTTSISSARAPLSGSQCLLDPTDHPRLRSWRRCTIIYTRPPASSRRLVLVVATPVVSGSTRPKGNSDRV
ncbi:hypothetical protein FRC19_008110 [Serendipita sp. 401]|nr:hypothetical protein FRC19_008110 [Serendipita sp. 401]